VGDPEHAEAGQVDRGGEQAEVGGVERTQGRL